GLQAAAVSAKDIDLPGSVESSLIEIDRPSIRGDRSVLAYASAFIASARRGFGEEPAERHAPESPCFPHPRRGLAQVEIRCQCPLFERRENGVLEGLPPLDDLAGDFRGFRRGNAGLAVRLLLERGPRFRERRARRLVVRPHGAAQETKNRQLQDS